MLSSVVGGCFHSRSDDLNFCERRFEGSRSTNWNSPVIGCYLAVGQNLRYVRPRKPSRFGLFVVDPPMVWEFYFGPQILLSRRLIRKQTGWQVSEEGLFSWQPCCRYLFQLPLPQNFCDGSIAIHRYLIIHIIRYTIHAVV